MATTFTVGPGDTMRPYIRGGQVAQIVSFPEAASQVFKAGELLILNNGGSLGHQVKLSGANPTADVVGTAVHDATGTQGTWAGRGSRTDSQALGAGAASSLGPGQGGSLGAGVIGGLTKGVVQVYCAYPNTLFVARCQSGGALSVDNIGRQFGVVRDAGNVIWRVDTTNTTQKVVQIVGLFDDNGDTNGRYIFKFRAAINALYGEF